MRPYANQVDNLNISNYVSNEAYDVLATFNAKTSYANVVQNEIRFDFTFGDVPYGFRFVGYFITYDLFSNRTDNCVDDLEYTSHYYNTTDESLGTVYLQNWAAGNSFYFRYLQDVYAYPIFEQLTYNISYYVAKDNLVGSANNIANYTTYYVDDVFKTATFDENYTPATTDLFGYTFKGWKVFNSQQISGNIANAVSIDDPFTFAMLGYGPNPLGYGFLNQVDNRGDNARADWTVEGATSTSGGTANTFVWTYVNDIYCYAVYEVNKYIISVHICQ